MGKAHTDSDIYFTYNQKKYYILEFTGSDLQIQNPVAGVEKSSFIYWWALSCDKKSMGVMPHIPVDVSLLNSGYYSMDIEVDGYQRQVHFVLVKPDASCFPENYRIAVAKIIS